MQPACGAEGARPSQSGADRPLRVLVVDDHATFAELLAMALDSQPDITCVGHVQDGTRAEHEVARLTPDVVLLDVHLDDVDGLALAARLLRSHPELRVLMLSASLAPENVARAAAAGACAYLAKSGVLSDVLAAVRTARRGGLVLSSAMVLDLVSLEGRSAARTGPAPGSPTLTAREQQVLELLAQGLDVSAIARRLGIRTSTCRGYVQKLLEKFDAHTQLDAVIQAAERGLVTVGAAAPTRARGS